MKLALSTRPKSGRESNRQTDEVTRRESKMRRNTQDEGVGKEGKKRKKKGRSN